MKTINLSRPINPRTLSPALRDALAKRLFTVHEQIFDGVSLEQFKRYVVMPDSKRTRIWILENEEGLDVGYITAQVFEAKVDKQWWQRNPLVYRTEVGMLPAYRGRNLTFRHLVAQYIMGFLMSGFRKSYFVATPVHPLPYKIAARQVKAIYPAPGRPTPQKAVNLMNSLSISLGLAKGKGAYGKQVGWIVRNSPQEQLAMQRSNCPYIRFYRQENPDYVKGHGLMTLIPFSFENAAFAVGRLLGRKWRKQVRHIRSVAPSFNRIPKLTSK